MSAVISHLNCIQELVERDRHYPWRVLVVCTLLNRTHGRGVRPMVNELFARTSDPESMVLAEFAQLEDLLRPLGFYNNRFQTLFRMSVGYCNLRPYEELYGVGRYALDSLALFVEGRTDVAPADTWLQPYLQWRIAGGPRVEWDRAGREAWVREQAKKLLKVTG